MSEKKRDSSVRTTKIKVLLKIVMLSLLAAALTATIGCELWSPGLGPKIDLAPPVVTIASHVNNDTGSGNVVLFGTVTDDTSVTDISLWIETEEMIPVIDDNTWRIEITTDHHIDGTNQVRILVTDEAKRTAEASVFLNFCNSVPVSPAN